MHPRRMTTLADGVPDEELRFPWLTESAGRTGHFWILDASIVRFTRRAGAARFGPAMNRVRGPIFVSNASEGNAKSGPLRSSTTFPPSACAKIEYIAKVGITMIASSPASR